MGPTKQNKRFPHFFKFYMPEHSLHRMKIPDAFIKQLKVLPRNVRLQNPMGKVWHIQMGYTDNAVCFLDGWQKFIADNSVVLGDLLVFRYNGDHIFQVKFFGLSGVEKIENSGMKGCDVPDIKEENEEEVEGKEEDDGKIVLDDEDDGGSNDSEDYNYEEEEMEDEDAEEEKLEATTNMRRKGKKSRGNNEGSMKTGARRARFRDDLKISEVRKYVKSQNPYFMARTIERKKDLLFVPSYVKKEFGLELPEQVTFHDELGGKWPGEVLEWKDGRTMIRGWRAVCRWNHVEEKDRCICEFLGGIGSRPEIIMVHVLRGDGSRS